MATETENTISFIIDELDFEPNTFMGFTGKEFMSCIGCLSSFFAITFAIATKFILGAAMYGIVFGCVVGVLVSIAFAKRAEVIKKGRPSYMIWVDLQRKIQLEGFLGIKINFGFINSTKWDVIGQEHDKLK